MARKANTRRRPRRLGGLFRPSAVAVELVLCLGIIGGSVYGFKSFAAESEYFLVKWIRVEGARILDDDTIRAATGITQESNILFLNPRAIQRRVEALPYIGGCRVTIVFPDTVVIRVGERMPYATLLAHNRCFAIDREGRILEEIALGQEFPGPLITNVPGIDSVDLGTTVAAPPLHSALDLWEAYSETEASSRLRVSELSAASVNDIRMYCENVPYEIRWGRGGYREQARRFDLLWQAKNGNIDCREYLDLRFGPDLVCR